MRRSMSLLLSLMLGVAPAALLAQERDEVGGAAPLDEAGDEIVVTGARERGSVIGDVRPEQQLGGADIRALGVTSIAELITELSPQTNGQPIVLLNGKRISSFSEIQDIPSEAVARVDILPEQVALSYGYAPTQKVANIVLRERFRAETGELRGGVTTDGGRESGRIDAGMLRIRGDDRLIVNLRYARAADLLESERGIFSAAPSRPFSFSGNVTGLAAGAEIDPALSSLVGGIVTAAAAPAAAANGPVGLADFAAGANREEISDVSPFRTLSPATESLSANIIYARALGGVSASVNGRVELSDSDSLQGLPALTLTLPGGNPFSPFAGDTRLYRYLLEAGALGQRVRGTTGHLGVTLNGEIGRGWQWSFTGNGDISDTRTRTDRGVEGGAIQAALDAGNPGVNPFGPLPQDLLATRLTDRARAKSHALVGDLLLTGSLFELPAGKVTTAIRIGASTNGFDSWSIRSGVESRNDYDRQIGSGQLSIDLPLTSRSKGVLGAVGDISVNVNAAAQHYSDFGTLSTLGYGMRWRPVPQVQLLASASQDRAAPTGAQLTDPLITTPNVSVFDYARGETVFVTQLSGGSGALRESVRDQFRLSATVKPFDKPNLTLTATYLNSRTRNPIAGFPTPTPAIEAAFPQRFLRDADGRLTQIDTRPINFLSAQSEQLRWGFDLSIPLKSRVQKLVEAWRAAGAKPEDRPAELQNLFGNRRSAEQGGRGEGAGPGGDEPRGPGERRAADAEGGGSGGGGRGPRGGGFGGGGGRGGGGRLSFSAYHTWYLAENIQIAPGVPRLDLLDGDATGSAGGQPRHVVEGRVGYTNNGLGARLSVNWESGTRVDGALGGASRLDFGGLATADLRLFANLGQMPGLVKDHPFLRGARLSIGIDNIFNSRRSVTDATGMTPLRYQPGYLDPLGRSITISFRKLFSAPPPGRGGA